MTNPLPKNLGLELARATEKSAIIAGRWMGLGKPDEADYEATRAIINSLNEINFIGNLVVEEEKIDRETLLYCGLQIGTGNGPEVDIVCDPIDGRLQLALGHPGALSVVAIAPHGSMWNPTPAKYMVKIIVNHEAAEALVPECIDAPAAWTLALVARAKNKPISDLTVFILDRSRHNDLIAEVRASGARVVLRSDGDIAGALMACVPDSRVDLLIGIGGALEGLIVACAVKSLGGGMIGRLSPQSDEERIAVEKAGLDLKAILNCDQIITSDDVFFAATGITTGPLLAGVAYRRDKAQTNSLIMRGITGTMRNISSLRLSDQSII